MKRCSWAQIMGPGFTPPQNPYLNSVILFIKESIHHPKRTKAIEKWGLIFYKIRVIHFSYYLSHFTHFTPPPKEDKDNGKMRFLKYYLNSHNILQNSYNNFFLLFISLYLVISPHCPMRITSMRKWAFLKYYLSSHYILQNSHYTFFFFFSFFFVSRFIHFTPPPKEDKCNGKMRVFKILIKLALYFTKFM